jgi:hypothetical protein
MSTYTVSKAMRFFFLVTSIVLWTGIWLTGFATVHWLVYLPAVFMGFAAISGICPGVIISNKLFGEKPA